jgi:hypothetical protein
MHYTDHVQKRAIGHIVDELAEKLYYHNYTISRVEAQNIGLPVKPASAELELVLYSLYEQYEQEMQLGQPFDPAALSANAPEINMPVAMLESRELSDVVKTKARVQTTAPGQPAILQIQAGQWITQSHLAQETSL